MKFLGKVGNGPMNKQLNFGDDPVTDPDMDLDRDNGMVRRRYRWVNSALHPSGVAK